ncbi:MAG: phosphoadenosine phosphosulfate reductase family protein [Pontibacterium sp.]
MIDLASANEKLGQASPQEIIKFALEGANKAITTTNFGPHEAVILHMVTQIKPDMPIIWIDSGYNTRDTYLVAEELIKSLNLNIEVYTPTMSSMRWDCAHGGVPDIGEEKHDEFTDHFKLAPFKRAMKEQAPDVWFTAVRSEQTEFRQNMEVFGEGLNGAVKVAPLLNWKEADMEAYLKEHGLPNVTNYFDPTKGLQGRECGLHTKF